MKICRGNPNLVKIRQKYRVHCMKTWVHFISTKALSSIEMVSGILGVNIARTCHMLRYTTSPSLFNYAFSNLAFCLCMFYFNDPVGSSVCTVSYSTVSRFEGCERNCHGWIWGLNLGVCFRDWGKLWKTLVKLSSWQDLNLGLRDTVQKIYPLGIARLA